MTTINRLHPPLRAGDVVSFRFPSTENDRSCEKPRPCLIVSVDGDQVVVAYGTSADTRANRGLELHVSREADLAAAHLRRPTRFVGLRRTVAALDSPRFCRTAATGNCRIGTLPPSLQPRLARLQEFIAEAVATPNLMTVNRPPVVVYRGRHSRERAREVLTVRRV